MNAPAVAAADVTETEGWRNFTVIAVLLALGLAGLGLIFRAEVAAALRTWEASTAYNHCFLILPITLYMIWDRREELAGLRPSPLPIAALLGLPVAVGWLLAERLGIMEGRQLMALSFAQVLFLAVLGWRLWWAVSGPLLYLYFLVPFGEFLVPRLQDITAVFIRFGLGLTSIPAYIDGYTIEIPEGTFYVAEACAGLRFLIASIAFGVLYALLMYRSPVRRAVFIAVSIIVPIIANGIRALGIVVLGHLLGSADAAAADHILYGWIFFSIVIVLLTILGLPFRQDHLRPRARDPDPEQGMVVLGPGLAAAIGTVAIAAISPGVALGLDRMGASAIPAPIALTPPANCTVVERSPAAAHAMPGRLLTSQWQCDGYDYDVMVETFSPRSTAGPVMAEFRRLTRPTVSEDTTEAPLRSAGGQETGWRIMRSTLPVNLAAARIWLDGRPASPGLGMRIHQARASVLGADRGPVLVVITPRLDISAGGVDPRRDAEHRLAELVLAVPDITLQLGTIGRPGN